MSKYQFSVSNRFSSLSFFLFLFFCSHAQNIERYYNYKWEECKPNAARFISLIVKTDSSFRRNDYFVHERKLHMSGSYEDIDCKIPNGHFVYYSPNGVVSSLGNYKHGKKEGVWLSYHSNKIMSDSCFYVNGQKSGISLTWHTTGFMKDSIVTNVDGSSIEVSWFDNGILSSAGRYAADGKKIGKWKYYHNNSKLSSLEVYSGGSLVGKNYFAEDGTAINDTTSNDRLAIFPGGIDAWMKYINQKLYFPSDYKITNGDKAVVVVSFTVNTGGNVEDVIISTPFYPVFDRIVENMIRKSPKWVPAIDHNRKVKCTFSQPITFANYNVNNSK